MNDDGYDYKVMTGVPVNVNEILAEQIAAGEIPAWRPREGYELKVCSNQNCKVNMWLGPRQMIALDLATDDYILLCMRCANLWMQVTGGGSIHHFGG